MNYYKSDRFQGMWLGSIVGAALEGNIAQSNKSEYETILHYQFSSWLQTRELIAQRIIQEQKLEAEYILEQLSPLLTSLTNIQEPRTFTIFYINILLTLLPLIAFAEDNRDIYLKLKDRDNFQSLNIAEIEADISVLTHLLILALNNQFEPKDTNVSMMVKQVVDSIGVKTTSSSEKLKIVSQAEKHGSGLKQLTEKLCQTDNWHHNVMSTATGIISLSFYCFASTPRNFMLSVKRASNLSQSLSLPVTALTATLSGAYNGVAGIPRTWRSATSHNQSFQDTIDTVRQLHKTWLGIHHINDQDLLYDPQIHAVAVPRIIQFRQNLKIISQKF